MRLKFIIVIVLSMLSLHVGAMEVSCTAGNLNTLVTDHGITALKVSGTMDARDFYFIAKHLRSLVTVDIADVTIVPCHTTEMYFLGHDFAADELPTGTFASMAVTSVQLPKGLKRIGEAAFADCERLSSIDLPSTLEAVGDYAFTHCSALTTVTLPASVREVGRGAFMRCGALNSFAVAPSGNLTRLGDEALMDCPALTAVNLGAAITDMGELALAGSGIKTLDLSASTSLAKLGNWALTLTPVTTVTLPAGMSLLGTGAFMYATSLTGLTSGQKLATVGDYALAGTSLQGTLRLSGLQQLGDYALYNVATLDAVELPATTKHLGDRSMAGMIGLTALSSQATDPPSLGNEVWAGVPQSKVPLTVPKSSVELYKSADQWMQFLFPNTGWLRGDVNGDGSVNISDINVVVNIILGFRANEETMLRADVNEDGNVNISDLNEIINIILNPSSKVMAAVDTDVQLRLPDVVATPGEETVVAVSLDHAGDYSALQCDISLPQGMTLVAVSCPEGYVMHSSEFDRTTARVVLYSPVCRHFDEDSPILNLTLRADAPLPEESWIQLSGAVIDSGTDGWHPADTYARVSTAGVNDLIKTDARIWSEHRTLCIETSCGGTAMVANLGGISRQLPLSEGVNRYELEPGIYVVMVNGKSHKIVIN